MKMQQWVKSGLAVAVAMMALATSAGAASAPGLTLKQESCYKCHSELQNERNKVPAASFAGSVHRDAKVTCSTCHGGDPTQAGAQAAHSGNFVGRPAPADGVQICGKCHQGPLENYLKGVHSTSKDTARKPVCVTCHGTHGIARASIEMIGDPLCSSCHKISEARRIYKALKNAEVELKAVDSKLGSSEQAAQARTKILEARSKLRALTHSLDLFEITKASVEALGVAGDVRTKVLSRMAAVKYGNWIRIGGYVAGGVLIVGGLLLIGFVAWNRRNQWLHLGPRPSRLVLILAGIALIVGTVVSWKGYNYIEHDPKFCISCHTMNSAYQLWGEGGHKKVDCHTCHKSDVVSNLHQLWFYATRKPNEVSKHAFIERGICETCHNAAKGDSKWNAIAETPGHSVHSGKQRIECTQCHAVTAHAFKAPKDLCAGCHKKQVADQGKGFGEMGEMHCLECHPFGKQERKRPLRPDRAACVECHDDAPKGMHKVHPEEECTSCHRPHEWGVPGRESCLECHGDLERKHHPKKSCAECHNLRKIK